MDDSTSQKMRVYTLYKKWMFDVSSNFILVVKWKKIENLNYEYKEKIFDMNFILSEQVINNLQKKELISMLPVKRRIENIFILKDVFKYS